MTTLSSALPGLLVRTGLAPDTSAISPCRSATARRTPASSLGSTSKGAARPWSASTTACAFASKRTNWRSPSAQAEGAASTAHSAVSGARTRLNSFIVSVMS